MASARYHDGDYHAAITAWFRLCWRSQPAATTALDQLPATATKLRRLWADFRNLDLDPAPGAPVFPAYLLLAEPGLVHVIPADIGDAQTEPAFRAVRRLLQHDDIDARKAVAAVTPWLLDIYLTAHVSR